MATKANLIARVREHLNDASSDRYSDPKIESALLVEARALFASEDVPSDMIGAVLSEADETGVNADGTFEAPSASVRIAHAYVGPVRITRVVMRKGLGKQTDHNSIATIGDPAIYREGASTYLLPPESFEGKKIAVFYVPEEVNLETIPAGFEDVITLGAASTLAADALEDKTSAILSARQASRLARILGTSK